MKCIDIVLPNPKTYQEFMERGWNNLQAQAIGESSFSKTIEVKESDSSISFAQAAENFGKFVSSLNEDVITRMISRGNK